MKITFLINHLSGDLEGEALSKTLTKSLINSGCNCTVVRIDWPLLSDQIAQAKASDLVVVAGGDGTVSSILGGVTGEFPPVAIYPLGTGNDLARELGFTRYWNPRDLIGGINGLSSLSMGNFTCWELLDGETGLLIKRFVNYLSLGFSASVVKDFSNLRARSKTLSRFGRFGNRVAYGIYGIRNLGRYLHQEISVTSKGGAIEYDSPPRCLIFHNIASIMGFGVLLPRKVPFEASITLTVINSLLDYLKMVFPESLRISTGYQAGSSNSWRIEGLKASNDLQIDGEHLEIVTSSLEIRPTPADLKVFYTSLKVY